MPAQSFAVSLAPHAGNGHERLGISGTPHRLHRGSPRLSAGLSARSQRHTGCMARFRPAQNQRRWNRPDRIPRPCRYHPRLVCLSCRFRHSRPASVVHRTAHRGTDSGFADRPVTGCLYRPPESTTGVPVHRHRAAVPGTTAPYRRPRSLDVSGIPASGLPAHDALGCPDQQDRRPWFSGPKRWPNLSRGKTWRAIS